VPVDGGAFDLDLDRSGYVWLRVLREGTRLTP
jgi:hypothetical protein